MVGSATFTTSLRRQGNVTAHSSASVTLPRPVGQDDPCGAPSTRSWPVAHTRRLPTRADLDPAADPQHRALLGQARGRESCPRRTHRVGDIREPCSTSRARRNGHRAAESTRAETSRETRPHTRPAPGWAVAEGTRKEKRIGHDLWVLFCIRGAPRTGTAPFGLGARVREWACGHRPIAEPAASVLFRRRERARRKKKGRMHGEIGTDSQGQRRRPRRVRETGRSCTPTKCKCTATASRIVQDGRGALQETLVSPGVTRRVQDNGPRCGPG